MQRSLYSITFYITNNLGHNILELLSILSKFPLTTSKVVLDIYHDKHGIPISQRVAKRFKTKDLIKLGDITKISKLGGGIA